MSELKAEVYEGKKKKLVPPQGFEPWISGFLISVELTLTP